MVSVAGNASSLCSILAFNAGNQLAVRRLGAKADIAFTDADLPMAVGRLESAFKIHTPAAEYFTGVAAGKLHRVFFVQVGEATADPEIEFQSIENLESDPTALTP